MPAALQGMEERPAIFFELVQGLEPHQRVAVGKPVDEAGRLPGVGLAVGLHRPKAPGPQIGQAGDRQHGESAEKPTSRDVWNRIRTA